MLIYSFALCIFFVLGGFGARDARGGDSRSLFFGAAGAYGVVVQGVDNGLCSRR